MNQIFEYKSTTNNIFFTNQKYHYGDLFGMCYLSMYKIRPIVLPLKRYLNINDRPINLYFICDSYLASVIQPDNFSYVDNLNFVRWTDEQTNINLDTSKSNVLIMETVERYFLMRFSDTTTLKLLNNKKEEKEKEFKVQLKSDLLTILNTSYQFLFKKGINDNIEFILFDNYLFTYLKQIRADLNYYLFNKLPPSVLVSSDKQYLYYRETIDSSLNTSSFRSIRDNELKNCIANGNYISNYYKKMGFDQVYISVIPNPATILGYKNYKYNGLIPKIQTDSNRIFETIDVYPEYTSSKIQLYHNTDTHWNSNGKQIWLDKANIQLENLEFK